MSDFGWIEFAVVFAAAALSAWGAISYVMATPAAALEKVPMDDPVVVKLSDGAIVKTSAAAGALLKIADDGDDWHSVHAAFGSRFPNLPETPAAISDDAPWVLPASDPGTDPAYLTLTRVDTDITITLTDPRYETALRHQNLLINHQLDWMGSAADHAPHPIWIVDKDQTLLWGNSAYQATARAHLGTRASSELLFDPTDLKIDDAGGELRCAIANSDPTKQIWFDIIAKKRGDQTQYFATDVTAVVRAEAAQRNFVQTLTKTFAHLSIGLAIFDRDRQLALFNPALIDLTELSPEFLSKRPNLMSFFDGLRENQVMPEPKNYSGWRETLADVVIAASDGRYAETWNLPSGLTYRVTGRPHPDGAIAFLFEDISAEISLTRRFREELEIGHAVLDTLQSAVAVFSPSGRLTFSNEAYGRLWNVESDITLGEVSAQMTTEFWQSLCQPSPVWTDIRDFIVSYGSRSAWVANVRKLDGKLLSCRVEPLTGGATLVQFDMAEATAPAKSTSVSA